MIRGYARYYCPDNTIVLQGWMYGVIVGFIVIVIIIAVVVTVCKICKKRVKTKVTV